MKTALRTRHSALERTLITLSVALAVAALSPRASARLQGRLPNELGRIPILEYHKIDRPEARWTRTPENFRADLERFWKNGYRLVALNDLLAGKIAVPAGTTPMVLTLDDSSPGQFKYLERAGNVVIDPDCAVGILETFEKDHPGFGHVATFFVLTGASAPNDLFNQKPYKARKLKYLAEHGYEIGNHTLWHADLVKYPESTVREQVARAQQEVEKAVPGYTLRTLALPHGDYPKVLDWVVSGEWKGVAYRNDAILKVAGPPALSPFDGAFDPLHLPRIQGIDSDMRTWQLDFERHPERRFVSDGDVNTITIPKGTKDRVRPAFAAKVVER